MHGTIVKYIYIYIYILLKSLKHISCFVYELPIIKHTAFFPYSTSVIVTM